MIKTLQRWYTPALSCQVSPVQAHLWGRVTSESIVPQCYVVAWDKIRQKANIHHHFSPVNNLAEFFMGLPDSNLGKDIALPELIVKCHQPQHLPRDPNLLGGRKGTPGIARLGGSFTDFTGEQKLCFFGSSLGPQVLPEGAATCLRIWFITVVLGLYGQCLLATFSLPCGWTGERKCDEESMSWDEGWERSLTKFCHGENRLKRRC